MYCTILKEIRGREILDLPGYTLQQPLDPFSSKSIVKQKIAVVWSYFRDFFGAEKIEDLSQSIFFAGVF